MRRVLITGAHGFLGRHVALHFKNQGCRIVGIGHGHWGFEKPEEFGIDEWIEAEIDPAGLSNVQGQIDLVLHCAGGNSVGPSIAQPLREFQRTVNTTLYILEYLRTKQPGSAIIYPSSAAVYGNKPDARIPESSRIAPFSPYGAYKKIVEDLCESYARNFDVPAVIIRFFSIYGAGLKKQLLWDGCRRLCSGSSKVNFYGTGLETRDWIHVKDAAELIYMLARSPQGYEVFNGGSGKRKLVSEILTLLSDELGSTAEITMGNENKPGDPKHFWADISRIKKLGWRPQLKIEDGVGEYVQWFLRQKKD